MTTQATHVISSEALYNVIKNEKNNKGGIFTIKSKLTGKDFTYKIKRSLFKNVWYTHIFIEQGYMEFNHMGTYRNGRIFKRGGEITTPAAIGIGFVLFKTENRHFQWLDHQAEIMHAGSCLLCGRVLTDAQSIERGLGPICAG